MATLPTAPAARMRFPWPANRVFAPNIVAKIRHSSTSTASGSAAARAKPVFFDMVHSNNAARVRLWMDLKRDLGMGGLIDTHMVQYPDLQSPEFEAVNPLKKVPALIRTDGTCVFESNVILGYLEDKYGDAGPAMLPPTPEGRQAMELLCRIHDLYIASPNITQPGYCHTQGAMYLSTGWHGPVRGMDLPTRAAKLAEIWKQLSWLEAQVAAAGPGPYLLGDDQMTLADLTWFPTFVFMEYMLPKVFGWPEIFDPAAATAFPRLAGWYVHCRTMDAFASTHRDIWEYWVEMDAAGQFAPIIEEISSPAAGLKFTYGVPTPVELNYQTPPPAGFRTGRYIDREDEGDVARTQAIPPVDENEGASVLMNDGRELSPPATMQTHGFALSSCPTSCSNFRDDAEVTSVYYEEMRQLVLKQSGGSRVCVFDHTIRESGNTNLNAAAGGSAAPVPRVHCDYTADGAPRRLAQLIEKNELRTGSGEEPLSQAEAEQLAEGRFAFVNVWRSIDPEHPVMQKPLAVCDERTVSDADKFKYELIFPDRVGENYSLDATTARRHSWYYYPQMNADECLSFKVYDRQEDGPRFVFHTAFDDPETTVDAPPRTSIEVRLIVFYE